MYFYFDDIDEYAYFARMNVDSAYGLVRVERPVFLKKTPLVTVRGNVLNQETNRPLNSVLDMLILPEESTYSMTISDQTTGSYEIRVPSGYQYKLISEKEGYAPFETTLSLENNGTEYNYDLDISMGLAILVPDEMITETDEIPEVPEVRPAPAPETESLESDAFEITFEFDSDKITEESYPVIDMLIVFMKDHEDIEIELAGFTDHIGNERYNNELALRRAGAVKKYMTDKGTPPNRIKILGFGERMPVVIGEDKKDLQMNRRVEYNFTK
jgi:outer membrane protein OmpA-like peptidoglycan-associated protein